MYLSMKYEEKIIAVSSLYSMIRIGIHYRNGSNGSDDEKVGKVNAFFQSLFLLELKYDKLNKMHLKIRQTFLRYPSHIRGDHQMMLHRR